MVQWNPADYAANSASQLTWAREHLARLNLCGDERVLDVGCGDGKVTAEIARAVPRGAVVGVDSSPEMIRFAQASFPRTRFPNLRFSEMDARRLRFAETFHLVFSNAALHWVDDHPAFLRGAAACLSPGGRLVVSCGGRGNAQDVFLAVRSTMRLKRWRAFFRSLSRPYFFHGPEEYERWLPRFGFHPARVQLAEKDTGFADHAALAGWLRTTWLPYTQRVPEPQREDFIAAVVERYVAKHPPDAAGQIRVRMVRLEINALKLGAEQASCLSGSDWAATPCRQDARATDAKFKPATGTFSVQSMLPA
ncbi:MAG TPA: methyltransferase domain-containing protein [Verrucomicrobiae bacterium]